MGILILLASEKQWDDISEICQDLKIPKIKIAYLKAYLIKRTKSQSNEIPIQPQIDDDDNKKSESTTEQTVESSTVPKEKISKKRIKKEEITAKINKSIN